jgi:hypothetical protein
MISGDQWIAIGMVVTGFALIVNPRANKRRRENDRWIASIFNRNTDYFRPVAVAAPGNANPAEATGDEPEIIIILVHGTWARDAPWATESSKLSFHLRMHLERLGPKAKLVIQTLRWTGENSFVGRARAADDLRLQMEANAAEYPNVLQFIIAHSHGGNIALLAQENPVVKAAGIICLSTPVIVVTGRGVFTEIRDDGIIGVSLATMFLLAALTYWPLAIAYLFMLYWLLSPPYATDEMNHALRSPNFDYLDRDNILFIRSHGDEASLALSTSSFVTWLSGRLVDWSLFWPEGLIRVLLRSLLYFVFAPVMVLLLFATRSSGPEAVRYFPDKRVYVEASPPGFWTVYGLRTMEIFGDDPTYVPKHGRSYFSDNSLAMMSSFIEKRVKMSRRARRRMRTS